MSETPTCGKCDLSLRLDEPWQYFGSFVAHQEGRCIQLLKQRIAELEARLEREARFDRALSQALNEGDGIYRP